MKDHTILVVVCVNNEELFKQCESQIRNIFVPPGYTVQIFPIRDAQSMASAYNRALSYQRNTKCIYTKIHILLIETCFLHLYLFLKKMKSLV